MKFADLKITNYGVYFTFHGFANFKTLHFNLSFIT